MTQSLDGILVVSLEQAVAAPYTSSRLADMGARVIKIEREEGDFARRYDAVVHGESAYFVWLNRGKQSLVVNIKDEEDNALLQRILAQADVFIQNLAPGAAARAGLDSAQLRERHPRLITCDISGYGEAGEYAKRKAYDLLVQGETGLAEITGTPEGPGRVGVSVCDIAAGMHSLIGILNALYERTRTGRGKGIKVSLFDGMADWMTVPLLHYEYGGAAPRRVGLNHPSIAPYGAYSCANGRVIFSIQNEREWAQLCEIVLQDKSLVDHPDFANNDLRVQNRAQLDGVIQTVFARLDISELLQRLETARVAYGELNDVAGLSSHPQLRRTVIDSPTGPVNLVASAIRYTDEDDRFGAIPEVGQHTQDIKAEFA